MIGKVIPPCLAGTTGTLDEGRRARFLPLLQAALWVHSLHQQQSHTRAPVSLIVKVNGVLVSFDDENCPQSHPCFTEPEQPAYLHGRKTQILAQLAVWETQAIVPVGPME
ncbi:hypothetical protein Plim_3513 [Planctopirus limnophila DSM 3776]|uniref:Uncharacterized protein n=1 Tax=Planctopirus limnophila (strain ATCC 43296 / DSM 3776 / IFAM 1008 / Mu 290) TaxID=521674 RepID=D5SV40_PLAL2|nr:hypothetical protein Plim_3513 [Planctopirus limnophila DSM 3776]